MTQDLQDLATDARFDAIVGRLVLMYFPAPDALLRRLLQLLVPLGIVASHDSTYTPPPANRTYRCCRVRSHA